MEVEIGMKMQLEHGKNENTRLGSINLLLLWNGNQNEDERTQNESECENDQHKI